MLIFFFKKNGWVKTELSRQTFEQRDSPLSKINGGWDGWGQEWAEAVWGLRNVQMG